jgi:hypothetical protein
MSARLSKLWRNSVNKFKGNPLSFNFKQVVLKHIGERRSDVYTHYVHSYPAKMFPYIPLYFFSIPEICPSYGIALDPLCGSGTVLLESIVHPLHKRNAYGVEMNPLGRLIAKVKTTPLDEGELNDRNSHLLRLFRECMNGRNIRRASLPKSEKINFWFSKRAIHKLSKLRFSIEGEGQDDDYKDFFWVCFSSVVRRVSKADPFIPPPVLLKLHKYKNSPKKYKILAKFLERAEDPDIVGLFKDAVEKNLERIRSLNKIEEVKKGEIRAQIIWDDARHIKRGKLAEKGMLNKEDAKTLPSESVDFIVTSPPYLTAQKYIRTQILELIWLGFTEKEIADLQKKIIGSERISLKEVDFAKSIGVETVDSLIKWASSSPRRGAELVKYFLGMKQVISEMYRVLKHGAYAVVVLGDNKVLGRNIETHKLLIDMASVSGFKLEVVLKDKIRGRGMITRRHNSGGLIKEEFIVVLKKEGENVSGN